MFEMSIYIVLIRGINVGGKNKIPMTDLKICMENLGYSNVLTYIASGNVILESDKTVDEVRTEIEKALPECFVLDDELIKVLVLTRDQLQAVIHDKPDGFGEQPDKYHSDAIFLIGIDTNQVLPLFKPREGVDKIWPGHGMIYSQRQSAQRTKSHLNKIMAAPEYKLMTIRNWRTTTKLFDLSKEMKT
jgi:uncharacterized protein (DUF1697 family)